MTFNISKVGSIAMKALATIANLVPVFESLKQIGGNITSPAARESVVDAALRSLLAAEGAFDRDLLDDTEFRAAAGSVVDSVVHFQNLIAKRHPALPA